VFEILFDPIEVGETFELSKIISDNDIRRFAEITGDLNPLHLDSEYAKKTRFRERIAHGFLIASLISAAIGNKLPGAIYLEQSLRFKRPVNIGDKIIALVEVLNKDEKHRFLKLSTVCKNQKNENVIENVSNVITNEILKTYG